MGKFQILCVTMNQVDFSRIHGMNIHSDVVFANQADATEYSEANFENNTAKMITTNTLGVGINRNLALLYATADICLFADDDMHYVDGLENIILKEFERLPQADAIVFNVISSNDERPQLQNTKTKRMRFYSKNPYGTFRVAVKLDIIRKKNIWFSTLFGGGSKYLSGEDSLFINDMRRNKLRIYLSDRLIGTVNQDASTWYRGYDAPFFYSKGVFLKANYYLNPLRFLHILYIAIHIKSCEISFAERIRLMRAGGNGFKNGFCFLDYINKNG